MWVKSATVALGAAAVLIVAGCGGGGGGSSTASDSSDTIAAQAVAGALKEFVAKGNYAKACSYYTDAAKAELATRAKGGATSCPAVLTELFRKVSPAAKKQLRQIRVTSTTVTGTHAIAKDSAGGTTYLTKQGAKWFVDKTPKPPPKPSSG
jgi:hypothetical protein